MFVHLLNLQKKIFRQKLANDCQTNFKISGQSGQKKNLNITTTAENTHKIEIFALRPKFVVNDWAAIWPGFMFCGY